MSAYVGAIDQGTTSSRFIVFGQARADRRCGASVSTRQIFPKPGWVEHDPLEIWQNVQRVMREALKKAEIEPAALTAIGITNQRETTLIWDRTTGKPLAQRARLAGYAQRRARRQVRQGTGGIDRFRKITGPAARLLLCRPQAALAARQREGRGQAGAGRRRPCSARSTRGLVWNLTGGPDGGLHYHRRHQRQPHAAHEPEGRSPGDERMLRAFDIPPDMLPAIRSSCEVYGESRVPFEGVPIAGILGDQQAAVFGQACFKPGEAKNTYGTGNFVLMNTGETPVHSKAGLVTTLAYKLGEAKPVYALEGSIAVTGSLVQWLRDNLGLIKESADIEALARTVEDNGDVYFVPAFSGLYAPHWRENARGIVAGLTRYANKGHLARAALEAAAYQTRDVLEAMEKDSKIPIKELRCDGGMVANDLLMQFQADILDVPVVRPKVIETTALGAAYAAGLATDYWTSTAELADNWGVDHRWHPKMAAKTRKALTASWRKALQRSFDWKDEA